ncbi:glycosyltransferase [Butyricimonas synergistica]|uniref:glycosyltransferase n=1 Tax=Butyricimonas synergistica TaxID=544644 RepID=UPI0022E638B5|nr:glycosyltransferase [Butyricimonas synergistica]
MNILFISKLSGNLWAGPNNSIPAQVKAQSRIDNVFWYNLNNTKRPEWCVDGLDCKNLIDYPRGRLCCLPAPFNKPDIVIIEECYVYLFCRIIKDIQRLKIPYIIIPRSSFTRKAQRNKFLKKALGNMIYFNSMIKKAVAIQYLTEEEKKESEKQWSVDSFVIPNGICSRNIVKTNFSSQHIKASYIGRIEIYQKGLDLLLDAIVALKLELRNVGFSIDLYGPNREGAVEFLRDKIEKGKILDMVKLHDAVFGTDKNEVLLNTDVFIMTSRFEGHPMGLIEALSYGIPCVATRGTYMAERIVESGAGWGAENELESIKNALKTMIHDRTILSEKGKKALQLADTYSWEKLASQSHMIFEKIIQKVDK